MNNKHDPWFNLEWFKHNKNYFTLKLTHYFKVIHLYLYDKKNFRFKRVGNYWVFWEKTKSGWIERYRVKILKNNRIKVGKRKALDNPYVALIAHRMKFLNFNKVWKKISKWIVKDGVGSTLKFHPNKGNYCLYVVDRFGNAVYVPVSHFPPERLDLLFKIWKERCS
jgi:hypothetical protein